MEGFYLSEVPCNNHVHHDLFCLVDINLNNESNVGRGKARVGISAYDYWG